MQKESGIAGLGQGLHLITGRPSCATGYRHPDPGHGCENRRHAARRETRRPKRTSSQTRYCTNFGLFQSVSQLFGPAPRSPLHRLGVRLRHSRSNTSTEYSLPGATQLSQVRSISPSGAGTHTGCTHGTHGRTQAHRRAPSRFKDTGGSRDTPESVTFPTFSDTIYGKFGLWNLTPFFDGTHQAPEPRSPSPLDPPQPRTVHPISLANADPRMCRGDDSRPSSRPFRLWSARSA